MPGDVSGVVSQRRRTVHLQQAQGGFSESESPLLHGALCESVAWSPCNSTGFTLQCV